MKTKILCLCGAIVTTNTLKGHLKSKKCPLSEHLKANRINILNLKTFHPRAWKKSEGANATADTKWFLSVFRGESTLEEWAFTAPRPLGTVPPKVAQKYSENRKGANNPASRARRPRCSVNTLKKRAKQIFQEFLINLDMPFRSIYEALQSEFPGFSYIFSDWECDTTKRGYSKQNHVIAFLLGISVNECINFAKSRRGHFIRRGQLSSPKFREVASEHAGRLHSRTRVTRPQKRLYEIVKQYDKQAILEYRLRTEDGRTKVYDIYSPKINALIEMHGRAFHESGHKPGLAHLVSENIKNDHVKKALAIHSGYRFHIFWDDEEQSWPEKISGLYRARQANIISYSEKEEDVFDITMGQEHNFILDSGAVAHNCSHSLSYGLVTYNGAWLKVNYPLEFWKGLLTAYGDDRDDIKDLFEECGHLVLPIDALHSEVDEWKIENNKLRPPLISVKDVGQKAAEGLRAFLDRPLESFERKPEKAKKAPATRKKKEEDPDSPAFGA